MGNLLEKIMKTLYETLLDDFDTIASNMDPMDAVKKFLYDNYTGNYVISKKPVNGKYEVYGKSDIKVRNSKIEYLTNGLFVWDSVARNFICSGCRRLKSLEGAPRKVGDSFDISGCIELESLKGGPEKVGYNFSCSSCINLKSLEGAPKKVEKHFFCNDCGKQFTEDDVWDVSKVGGTVITKFRD